MAGSRKEYELLFKLKAALGGNFNSTFKSALKTTRELQGTIQKVNGLQGKINGFQRQSAAITNNKNKLAELTAEHERLQREMSQTETPSESLRKKMERNERQIEQTTRAIEEQEQRLGEMGDELRRAGVNTDNLEGANERLRRSYERLKQSQEEYARISAAQQKNNQAISQTKAQLGGVIGTATALGAALYAGPINKTKEFQAQMSSVKSIIADSYGTSPEGLKALEKDMGRLNAIAKEMGATTKFTATESGQALQYMAMAGWNVNAKQKMSIFAEIECHFSAVSIAVYTALIHHFTCRLEACQALIYQLVSGLTGENGKYNYSIAVHVYPPFFDIPCSAKNYKIAPALTKLHFRFRDTINGNYFDISGNSARAGVCGKDKFIFFAGMENIHFKTPP